MDYKLSRFNVLFERNSKYYVSNTFSHCVIELEKEEFFTINNKRISELPEEIVKVLYEEGVLVENELDEIGLLRYMYDKSKNNKDYMEFVVAPTLDCNFACPYCFETKRHHSMDSEIQRLIVDFYEEQISISKYKKVKFAWYGGEPLLEFDIVRSITEKVNELNEKYNVTCEMVMTTNGYLINREVADEIERLGFKYIQVTLDGPQNIHDRRRVLLSGEGTFQRIIKNIELFRDSKVMVSVRMNIDKENSESYKELSSEIKALKMNNVREYPALVEFTPNQDTCRECTCMNAEEFSQFALGEASEYYFDNNGYNCNNISVNCGAEHKFSYVIDDMGDVYKCWNSVGYENEKLFNLKEREELNPVVISRFLGRDPFTENECNECPYIPICGGGCAYDYLFKGTHTCVPERFLYKDIMMKEGGL